MSKRQKLFERFMSGAADADIAFDDLCKLLLAFGFDERIRGDHHIFTRRDLQEILNLQPKGGQAKPYQVKQVRAMINKYGLKIEENE